MSSRIRFTSARQIFDTFRTARQDIAMAPGDEEPLVFARKLAHSKDPVEAVAFCAYLLPRREAVWWGCQCVRAIRGDRASGDPALAAAEAWVREPDETTQRAALELSLEGDKRAATLWLARAAGWSGGNISPRGMGVVPAAPHLTAKAVHAAIVLAMAKGVDARDYGAWSLACVEACTRFAEGGDARPRVPPGAAPQPTGDNAAGAALPHRPG